MKENIVVLSLDFFLQNKPKLFQFKVLIGLFAVISINRNSNYITKAAN